MSLPVTPAFIAATTADVNKPVAKVQLVLGNYASAAAYGSSASSSGDAANYPAAGAIDGDRTEINVGPASGADNDVGQSSWRSTGTPDNGDTVTLDVVFTQARTINRIKLYHLSSHALKTFQFSYWNGSAWVVFAATSDVVAGGQTSIPTTGALDVVDFPDLSTTKVRLQVTATAVAMDKANVVEIEIYRLVDISDRVKSVRPQRQRDYRLANPLATTLSLECINSDRFFSISHVPTTDEIEDGFVNSELRPSIGVILSMGFDLPGTGPELVSNFVGSVDRIQVKPGSRDAVIEARDGMKGLINRVDFSKLKSNKTIDENIRYVLNRANVSNYEMALDVTSISVDYFFTENQDSLTTIRDLTQAAADAIFFFDESGIATFRFFQASTILDKLWTSNSDWNAGVLTGDMQAPADQLDLLGSGAGSGETVAGAGQSDGFLNIPASALGITDLATKIVAPSTGTITQVALDLRLRFPGGGSTFQAKLSLCADSAGSPGAEIFSSVLTLAQPGVVSFPVVNVSWAVTLGTTYWIKVSEGSNGSNCVFQLVSMNVASGSWSGAVNSKARYVPTSGACPGKPGSTTAWQDVEDSHSGGPIGQVSGNYVFNGSALSGTWQSATLDLGATVNALGGLTKTEILNAGTSAYFTRTSADGSTWDPWVAVSGSGQINSTVRRYMQARADLALSNDSFTGPIILDITVTWTIGGGSPKYKPPPAVFTFAFDSAMLDVAQEVSDNLGGDTAILNDVTVQAKPLVLTGADADTVWQGTIGTPPVAISGTNTLSVVNGDVITIPAVISGGMDISRMSGANPAAAVVTFGGGATGSWVFSSIHPTKPVLVITITHAGTITDLRITGKKFSSVTYLQAKNAQDAASIALNGPRQQNISNPWIVSTTLAQSIADRLVANFKDPVSYIPTCEVRAMFSAQLGDRCTIVDENLDLSADYVIVGLQHRLVSSLTGAEVGTTPVLMKVPAGS